MKSFKFSAASFCLGIVVAVLLLPLGVFCIGTYLVVENEPEAVDTIIVLGGGDGSRLQQAVAVYDKGLGEELLLVDELKSHWDHVVKNQCKERCQITGKKVNYVNGSTNTYTDAKLTLRYCLENNIDSVLVVTDPYHSRRADVIFSDVYDDSGIYTVVINTGYYEKNQRPGEGWLPDWITMRTMSMEFLKIIHYKLTSIINT